MLPSLLKAEVSTALSSKVEEVVQEPVEEKEFEVSMSPLEVMLSSEPANAHKLALAAWNNMTRDKLRFFEASLKVIEPTALFNGPDAEYDEWTEGCFRHYGMRHKRTGKKHGVVRTVGFSIVEGYYRQGVELGLVITINPGDFVDVKLIDKCKERIWRHIKFNSKIEVVEGAFESGMRDSALYNRNSLGKLLPLADLKKKD